MQEQTQTHYYKAEVTLADGKTYERLIQSSIELDVDNISKEAEIILGQIHRDTVFKIEDESDELVDIKITKLDKDVYNEIKNTSKDIELIFDNDNISPKKIIN